MSRYEIDILTRGLSVIFCGLNPATSAATDGHNFSHQSNRFWSVLHLAVLERKLVQFRPFRAAP
jgi:TDG/mug DNA glycosylase family protein